MLTQQTNKVTTFHECEQKTNELVIRKCVLLDNYSKSLPYLILIVPLELFYRAKQTTLI